MDDAPHPSRKLILIVEDDDGIREALQELLEFEGFDVVGARDGQIAIDFLKASPRLPQLVLLDLMMPRKDGMGFREEQRQDERLKHIPVVIMSADGNVAEKKARAGAAEYLKKPVEMDVLLAAVERFSQ